jgi:hypothetical protein
VERGRGARARVVRLIAVAAAVALGLAFAPLLPVTVTLLWNWTRLLFPWWVRRAMDESVWFLALLAVAVPLTLRPRRIGPLTVPAVFWARLDAAASWALGRRLALALAIAAGVMLVTWIPHYLTWPWWNDTEYFAVSAQAWDAGILPYRDLYDFNFPGPTYVHWLIGKVFGWGHTVPFNALDAALVVALGAALAAWSRNRFGTAAPGLVGYLAFLGYYFALNYTLVAQRDWQAPLFVVLGLLVLEVRRDRVGLVASALAFAAALTYRPHPVVLLPALLSAIDENARGAGEPWSRTARAVAIWSGVVAVGLLAGAAPVVLAGVADDFLYWFRVAWFGGNYHRGSTRSFPGEILGQLGRWETDVVFLGVVALAVAGSLPRRTARTWALALLSVLLYRPLSPVLHDYLRHPLILVWSVALAVVSAWVLTSSRLVPVVRLLTVAVIVGHVVPGVPEYCRPWTSAQALADLARGRDPAVPPPGCEQFLPARFHTARYWWEDYCSLLAYLREKTGPRTFVANFFRSAPFPAVNAPTGRLTAFPSPGGILWLRSAAPGLEDPFVEALARPRETVVVWAPSFPPRSESLFLERLEETIRRLYEPEARFGTMEVWRRRPAPPAERGVPGNPPGS